MGNDYAEHVRAFRALDRLLTPHGERLRDDLVMLEAARWDS